MSARPHVATTAVLALAALLAFPGPAAAQAPEPGPAPADSLTRFLEELTDSTDLQFGSTSVAFDTLGLDTLEANALTLPSPIVSRRRFRTMWPIVGYHRATGFTAGLGLRTGSPALGVFDLRGSYATSAKLGRYAFAWRKTIWAPGPAVGYYRTMAPGRIGERTRLDLDLRYARENLAFMPEHADPDNGALGAFISGTGEQSIYESRGWSAGLTLWTGDWRFRGGVLAAHDKPLPVATRFSLFGKEEDVAENTAALDDEYVDPYGGIAFWRPDLEFGGTLDGTAGGGDRWRLHGVVVKALRLGSHFKWAMQVEGGAAAALAPRQRRFEIGGAVAVPTLLYGQGGTDHMLFGRGELTASTDVLKTLGLPHPAWLVLQPSLFVDAGSVWDAGRDVVFASPPSNSWVGAAGGGFTWKIGIPEPDVSMRMWMSWPVGPNSGEPRFNFSVGRMFPLLKQL